MESVSPTPHTPDSEIARLLGEMTLEQKAGQVLMLGFDGITLTDELRSVIADLRPGGLVLFERNATTTPQDLAKLTSDAQAAARVGGDPTLLISIDQEGGAVTRLRASRGFAEFPSAMAIAATGDAADAGRVGAAIADELLAVGINMDLAPDLDVNSNPANPVIGTRSFGSDPDRVAELGAAFIEGMQARGVMAVGKHFPGHGDTAVDSHVGLPVVAHERPRLEAVEFVPFRRAMACGVAGIMSAHIAFPAIEPAPGLPATLSARALTGLLREEMGFDGLIFTDSLIMGALVNEGRSIPQASAAALMAGADVLLFNNGSALHRMAHAEVVAQVRAGRIPEARLDAAVRRILVAKQRYGLLAGARPAAPEQAGAPERKALAREIAAKSITVVRDGAGLLPARDPAGLLVVETPQAAGLARALGAASVSIGAQPRAGDARLVMEAARGRTILVATSDILKNPQQAELVRNLRAAGLPVIVVAVRLPYDLLHLGDIPTFVATYQASEDAFAALADVVLGRRPATGTLPVAMG
jgi:beta-N-acetylhexosaminidase